MINTKLIIPLTESDDMLTIIYKEKGKTTQEIQIKENEFFKCLRYFKERRIEIMQTKIIFIHDDINTDLFFDFLSSIQTKEINIKDENYKQLYQLSNKYGYEELKKQIELFMEKRPDITSIIEEISTNQDESNIIESKENIITKNLDLCIKSGFLDNVDIKTILRIINSPKRVINDHHIFYNFVINLLQKLLKDKSKDEQENYYQFLPSALDYNQMSDEEIIELLNIMGDESFFSPSNANNKLKDLISRSSIHVQDDLETKFEALQIEITEIKKKHQEEICKIYEELKIKSTQIDDLSEKLNTQNSLIKKLVQEKNMQQQNNRTREQNNDKKEEEEEEDGVINIFYNNKRTNALNGIISYLGKGNGLSVIKNGIVKVTASSINQNNPFFKPENIFDYQNSEVYFASQHEVNPWLCFDFKDYRVKLYHYTIQTSPAINIYPQEWKIFGSKDKNLWFQLEYRYNYLSKSHIESNGVAKTYEISEEEDNEYYRYFRFLQKEDNRSGHWSILTISSIDFFGKIKKIL